MRYVLLATALAACAPPPRLLPEDGIEQVLGLLRAGEIETADTRIQSLRRRFPQHGGLAALGAAVADLVWDDGRAIVELQAVLASQDRAGWTLAMARGRLGDQLFAAGRFGESVLPLLSSATGEGAERRRAYAVVARELPFRRKQAGPLATEVPLLDSELTEFVCSIGDQRRAFAIDTGSTMTTLSHSLATAVGVRSLLPAGIVPDGTGLPVPVSLGVIDSFAVGDIWLGSMPVLVVGDERLAMRDLFGGPARAPGAVLGLDVVGQFRMTIDPERRSVVLERPRSLPEGASVQCVRVGGRCLAPVAIEGQRLWFVLDTGASHSSLTAAGLEALPDGPARATPVYRRVRTAGGGTIAVRELRNLILRVSLVRFPGVDLPIVPRPEETLFPIHGVLGVDLLRQCRITLDGGRVRLESATRV